MLLDWRVLIVFFLFLGQGPTSLSGQSVQIRLHSLGGAKTITFQALGECVVSGLIDSFPVPLKTINTLEKVVLKAGLGKVSVEINGQLMGNFSSVLFSSLDEKPKFNLIPAKRRASLSSMYGNLWVKNVANELVLDNHLHLEDYIKGVVYAEAGHHKSKEFFKVQATSARTYAIKNLNKHGREGFDLCNTTHCQVYKGIPSNAPLLEQSVQETKGEVAVIGESNQLIEAVFSANCGGFTANSEDVWISKVDYLRATPDHNYCDGFKNHEWHLTINKWDFLANLGKYLKVDALSFQIEPDVSGRVKRVYLNGNEKLEISGEEIRILFRLKSSKFHIFETGNFLLIEGTGYGHGVGLCQDGAFHMSELGLDYNKILEHYYKGVQIKNLKDLPSPLF